MTLQRQNPLPIGRYWVDVFDSNARRGAGILDFSAWIARNADKIVVENTHDYTPLKTGAKGRWYLFSVVADGAKWDTAFGYPTITQSESHPNAPKIEKQEDTGKRPKVYIPSPIEAISDLFGSAKTLAIIALGVYLYSQLDKKH